KATDARSLAADVAPRPGCADDPRSRFYPASVQFVRAAPESVNLRARFPVLRSLHQQLLSARELVSVSELAMARRKASSTGWLSARLCRAWRSVHRKRDRT